MRTLLLLPFLAMLHAAKRPRSLPAAYSDGFDGTFVPVDGLEVAPKRRVVTRSASRHPAFPPTIFDHADVVSVVLSWFMRMFFPLRPRRNPMIRFSSVCKAWHRALHSVLVWEATKATPSAALYILMQSKSLDITADCPLFAASRRIMNQREQLAVLQRAADVQVLVEIGCLGSLVTTEDAELLRVYRRSSFVKLRECSGDLASAGLDRYLEAIEAMFSASLNQPPSAHVLFSMPQVDLVRMFFLEDLSTSRMYSLLFVRLISEVCRVYHEFPDFRPELEVWVRNLNKVTFPRSGFHVLYACFGYALMLASLAGDLEFIRMFGLDYDALIAVSVAQELPCADLEGLKGLLNGDYDCLPRKALSAFAPAIRCMIPSGFFGFASAPIRRWLELELGAGTFDQEVTQMIRAHLF